MRIIVALLAALLASGCSSIASKGAELNDDANQTAKFTICRAISVGAWTRDYGQSAELAAAWRTLCAVRIEQTPAK